MFMTRPLTTRYLSPQVIGLTALFAATFPACTGENPSQSLGSGGATGSGGHNDSNGGGGLASGGSAITGGSGGSGSGGDIDTQSGGVASGGGHNGSGGDDAGSGGAAPSSCVPDGKAHNPLVTQIFTADPNAVVYNDRLYVYASHDEDGQDGFDMIDYHVFSSDDMVNWQDHGVIINTSTLPWASRLYAPGACEKNGKYYLYMPNSGSAIGVAIADDPGGPFVDARGTALITPSTPGVNDVDWLFDPACLVDDDGQAYLYFGGGPEGTGDNGRVIRLNEDMISLKDNRATTLPIPALFEAIHVVKHEGVYYMQYSSDFSAGHGAALEYMTSTDPMTGWQHQGKLLPNANINNGNNNHGSIVEYKGKTYLFYHNRKLQQELGVNKVNNRSMAVQEMTWGPNNTINQVTMSTDDYTVTQLKCLDGFSEVQAETLAEEHGIEVDGKAGEVVHIADISNGDWIAYSQVDFRDGATKWVGKVASAAGGGTIDVVVDGCIAGAMGTSVGSCEVVSTGGASTYAEITCTIEETSGAHDLCLKFSGSPSFVIDSWHLE